MTGRPAGREGWLYLASVIECCSRRVVGWSIADHLRAELVVDALEMAVARRRPGPGLVHHSDQGLGARRARLRPALRRCRHRRLNGVEWRLLRQRCLRELPRHDQEGSALPPVVANQDEARTAIFEYIEAFYNRERLHSTLWYLSPITYEEQIPRPHLMERKIA